MDLGIHLVDRALGSPEDEDRAAVLVGHQARCFGDRCLWRRGQHALALHDLSDALAVHGTPQP